MRRAGGMSTWKPQGMLMPSSGAFAGAGGPYDSLDAGLTGPRDVLRNGSRKPRADFATSGVSVAAPAVLPPAVLDVDVSRLGAGLGARRGSGVAGAPCWELLPANELEVGLGLGASDTADAAALGAR
jgi:hypothetical protein